MKNQKGFSLIELMIVVAIIGIIAAIAIPALLRARIAANESGAKSDLKATTSSTVTYANGNNGAYPTDLACMGDPEGCPAGSLGVAWPPGTSPFLDPLTGCVAATPGVIDRVTYEKSGYTRTHNGGVASTAGTFDYGVNTWTMNADPIVVNNTGLNNFGTDHTGLVCFRLTPFPNAGDSLPVGCQPIGG